MCMGDSCYCCCCCKSIVRHTCANTNTHTSVNTHNSRHTQPNQAVRLVIVQLRCSLLCFARLQQLYMRRWLCLALLRDVWGQWVLFTPAFGEGGSRHATLAGCGSSLSLAAVHACERVMPGMGGQLASPTCRRNHVHDAKTVEPDCARLIAAPTLSCRMVVTGPGTPLQPCVDKSQITVCTLDCGGGDGQRCEGLQGYMSAPRTAGATTNSAGPSQCQGMQG
jgi:hypothetical protein